MQQFDMIFTSASLPDATAIDVLAYVRGTVPDMPVVVVGEASDVDLAAEAIRCGAVEFLLATGHEMVTVPLAVETCGRLGPAARGRWAQGRCPPARLRAQGRQRLPKRTWAGELRLPNFYHGPPHRRSVGDRPRAR